jgi:hemin uptake protein HemP
MAMTRLTEQQTAQVGNADAPAGGAGTASTIRIKSRDLLQQMREIEIDHEGRIYRLRLTQLNKLILTA